MKTPKTIIALLLAATGLLAAPAWGAQAIEIKIDAEKTGPVINKNIYGQFAEHLGHGVYEGMWVGPHSKTPNTKGWRNDVLGALKALKVPLVRWPGGCFADEYHWRDGIGPRGQRPVRVNTSWGGVEEPNAVGTHEFFELAELLGADTYVNGNLGSGTVQEMAEWLEYMTSDSKSSLAELRRKNGRNKPFKVDFFAIGNEAWGCGGNMTPAHYTNLFNQYALFLKAPKAHRPALIVSGGYDADTKWSEHLAANIKDIDGVKIEGISYHYYTLPTGDWTVKGAALGFNETDWINTLNRTLHIEELININVAAMDKSDPKRKFGLLLDEWGTWYDVEKGTNASFLYQQSSLRDAVVAALNFNIFHAHADRVRMTNIAQMVNVLQAMILTNKDKMILTPTYHAFQMYIPFQDATALGMEVLNNTQYTLEKVSIPSVSASAARAKDGKVYLAVVNTNPNKAEEIDLSLVGKNIAGVKGQLLTAKVMDAHNTFAQPRTIEPVAYSEKAKAGKMTLTVPAKSVLVVAIE